MIAAVRRRDRTNTGLAVRNSEREEIGVTFSLRDEGGFASMRIGAGARIAVLLDQLFTGADLEGFAGEVVIRSQDGKLSAVAIEFGDGPGQRSALPVSRMEQD